jgi:hypothetical protein
MDERTRAATHEDLRGAAALLEVERADVRVAPPGEGA